MSATSKTPSKKYLHAAALVAEDALTIAEIAQAVGVSGRTINYWKLEDEFRAHVLEYARRFESDLESIPVARRGARIARNQLRWNQLKEEIDSRRSEIAKLRKERDEAESSLRQASAEMLRAEEYGDDLDLTVAKQRAEEAAEHLTAVAKRLTVLESAKDLVALTKEEREIAEQAGREMQAYSLKLSIDLTNLSDEDLIAQAKAIVAGDREAGPGHAGEPG
ncbi:MAG TPA: hypothetical protein PKA27_02285 [Fimbriimonadaceae bacterium]|nr:hypothetical protein [Fimbriimonadaceae bacterium]